MIGGGRVRKVKMGVRIFLEIMFFFKSSILIVQSEKPAVYVVISASYYKYLAQSTLKLATDNIHQVTW